MIHTKKKPKCQELATKALEIKIQETNSHKSIENCRFWWRGKKNPKG